MENRETLVVLPVTSMPDDYKNLDEWSQDIHKTKIIRYKLGGEVMIGPAKGTFCSMIPQIIGDNSEGYILIEDGQVK